MISIDNNKFIFSDERKYRILRHLVFWVFWGFYFGTARLLNPAGYKKTGHFANPIETIIETFFFDFASCSIGLPNALFYTASLHSHWQIHQGIVLGYRILNPHCRR